MRRSFQPEIMDSEKISGDELTQVHRQIQMVHHWLGNTNAILDALRREQATVKRVLDIGCGRGGLLIKIRDRLGIEVVGVDLRAAPPLSPVSIFACNAVTDLLPEADVAVCMMLAHHLSEADLTQMIANVSRSCQRFVILDLVRHPAPLWLFRAFVAPLLDRTNALDGQTSIRRAYTAIEMRAIVNHALAHGRAVKSLHHTIAPLWMRQIVDIRWEALA
jgi:2-polyprenyl-3-methyl-5-hydroxy-6-metoxy-1,4-benzoquinol methylase